MEARKGSVKDVFAPVELVPGTRSAIFEYSDAYSVFDWGRMPDLLPRKGEALTVLAADWFEKLERPETWKEFSRSPEALALRKGNRFGAVFNELGEKLQSEGLRTHYQGVVGPLKARLDSTPPGELRARKLSELPESGAAPRHLAVREVSVVKPRLAPVMGRVLPDYTPTRQASLPRLIPLEVVFRFSLPVGSSLFERVARDPEYLASIGFGGLKLDASARWDFPVLELFTKLESSDRVLGHGEALAISGLSSQQLQDLLFRTAWVAGAVRWLVSRAGLELADGKFEWALGADGEIFLVDAIGPDELRILKDGLQLSKEFLRGYYRKTPWYEALGRAKDQAKAQGVSDWKRGVSESPPALPADQKELATQMYLSLANRLTGKNWFPTAWGIDQVVQALGQAQRAADQP